MQTISVNLKCLQKTDRNKFYNMVNILNVTLIEIVLAHFTVKMNMLYLINRIVATDYKQYY